MPPSPKRVAILALAVALTVAGVAAMPALFTGCGGGDGTADPCGDGYCDTSTGEPCWCETDCGPSCPDGACDCGETCSSCPSDCGGSCDPCLGAHCTNGACDCGETCSSCPGDCPCCGNGLINGGEECDGSNLNGATCASREYDGGTLRCTSSCRFDEAACTIATCGNGAVDSGEDCDRSNLGGATCSSLGYTGGTLRCSSACAFDYSGCTACIAVGDACSDTGDPCCDPTGCIRDSGPPIVYLYCSQTCALDSQCTAAFPGGCCYFNSVTGNRFCLASSERDACCGNGECGTGETAATCPDDCGICGSATCPTGCCDSGGTCQAGTSATACGTGGSTCRTCSGSTPVCSGGTCVPSTPPCGSGAGDNCTCPLDVAGAGGTYSGSTVGLTGDYIASCGSGNASPDVVYTFTPSTSGSWQIDTNTSAYDTVLQLRSGGCPGSEVDCDDDDGDGTASLITATLAAGVTYYIIVSGYGAGAAGSYTLNVRPSTASCGDGSCNGTENQCTCSTDCGACAGCCDSGSTCRPGNTGTYCGSGGATCRTCSGSTPVCSGGTCVSSGVTCGDGSCNGTENQCTCSTDCGTCAGCCDSGSSCRAGTSATYCGTGGATCRTCSGSTPVCSGGTCIASTPVCGDGSCNGTENQCTCSRDCGTCAGCCDSGSSCRAGTSTTYCGTGGATCRTCSGSTPVCSGGTCVSSCGDGVCGSGETCASCWTDCGEDCGLYTNDSFSSAYGIVRSTGSRFNDGCNDTCALLDSTPDRLGPCEIDYFRTRDPVDDLFGYSMDPVVEITFHPTSSLDRTHPSSFFVCVGWDNGPDGTREVLDLSSCSAGPIEYDPFGSCGSACVSSSAKFLRDGNTMCCQPFVTGTIPSYSMWLRVHVHLSMSFVSIGTGRFVFAVGTDQTSDYWSCPSLPYSIALEF